MNDILNIYIGYDTNETIAYHVLCQSIIEKSSLPLKITPLNLKNLNNVFFRKRSNLQSTEFSFSRFLVPYLSNYCEWSLFMDCDMIVKADINELFKLKDESKAVLVCKHNYIPKEEKKFLGNTQLTYEKKNWSSVMLFNNIKCKSLTPEYVNTATGLELHQFKWLEDENLIGAIPLEWNWLVGEYPINNEAKNLHFTLGGPYFEEYKNSDNANDWHEVRERLNFAGK